MPKSLIEQLQDEVAQCEPCEGFSPADLFTLPKNLRALVQRVMRDGEIAPSALMQELESSEEIVELLLQRLVEQGYLMQLPGTTPPRYKARLGPTRNRRAPGGIWDALGDKGE